MTWGTVKFVQQLTDQYKQQRMEVATKFLKRSECSGAGCHRRRDIIPSLWVWKQGTEYAPIYSSKEEPQTTGFCPESRDFIFWHKGPILAHFQEHGQMTSAVVRRTIQFAAKEDEGTSSDDLESCVVISLAKVVSCIVHYQK